MRHRAEIDGLRAIAVAAVLVFHFFPSVFPLGYLGVDLFFVISGFLISSYIIEEKSKSTFSFKIFYWRRIKRILPATLIVLMVTTVFAFLVLTPPDLIRYSHSLLSTLTFTANIFFWRTGGYFGSSDELKPLLHMWSLGIEEQFYLFFPIIFVLIISIGRKVSVIALLVGVITLLSFFLNIFLVKIGGANPAFFLLPARVWQFGVGTLAALAYRESRTPESQGVTFLSFLMIVVGFVLTPSLLPVATIVTLALGAFLARSHVGISLPMQLLTYPLVRKVGLISFSIYLWHWPIIVLMKYYFVSSPPLLFKFFGLAVTVAVSCLSYRFVEEPFRRGFEKKIVLRAIGSSVIMVSLFVVLSISTEGFRGRHSTLVNTIASATQTNYRCPVSDYISYGGSRACILNKNVNVDYSVALVGNSHAQMYAPALAKALSLKHEKGILIPLNSCLPTIDLNISMRCLELANKNYSSYVSDDKIGTIIFATTWYEGGWVDSYGREVKDLSRLMLAKAVIELVKKVEATGKEVFLVGPIQIPHTDLSSTLSRKLMLRHVSVKTILDELKVPRSEFEVKFGDAQEFLSATLGGHFVMPSKVLCDEDFCFYGNESEMFFADSNHLGASGARLMTPMFERILETR